MNLRTKDMRNSIERQFDKLGLDTGRIIPNQFESSQMLDNGVTP
jgi:glucuronate isomerase